MTDYERNADVSKTLTEQWKAGKIESLGELIKQIEEVDNRRALSDEYLIERNNAPRSEYAPAEEWGYGIVWAMSDYVLPYLKELQALKAENAKLKEKINNISKQTKTLRDKVMLWKNGLFCTTEKSALFYVEKVLTNIEEALK